MHTKKFQRKNKKVGRFIVIEIFRHNVIKSVFHEFNPTGFAGINVNAALQSCVNIDPEPSNEGCILGLKEHHMGKALFHEGLIYGFTTCYGLLKHYLVLNGFVYQIESDKNCLPNAISHSFLDDGED